MRLQSSLPIALFFAVTSGCSTETPVPHGDLSTGAVTSSPQSARPATQASASATVPRTATTGGTAPSGTAPSGSLRERVLGRWRFESTPSSTSALQGGVEKAAGKKLAPAPGQIAEMLSQMTVEVTPDALITRRGDVVFSTEPYEVVSESKDELALKLRKGTRPERYSLQDDDTLIVTTTEVGVITMKRVR